MNSIKVQEPSDKQALEVLEILDRWDERLQGHHSQMRNHERKKYRTKIAIYLSHNDQQNNDQINNDQINNDQTDDDCPQYLSVWCRNISQSGLSFIYHADLKWNHFIICLNPEAEETLWYHAEMTRSRQVHNGFWEFGVKLLNRAEK